MVFVFQPICAGVALGVTKKAANNTKATLNFNRIILHTSDTKTLVVDGTEQLVVLAYQNLTFIQYPSPSASLTWTVDTLNIVRISPSGLVTATGSGTVVIQASAGGVASNKISLTVAPKPNSTANPSASNSDSTSTSVSTSTSTSAPTAVSTKNAYNDLQTTITEAGALLFGNTKVSSKDSVVVNALINLQSVYWATTATASSSQAEIVKETNNLKAAIANVRAVANLPSVAPSTITIPNIGDVFDDIYNGTIEEVIKDYNQVFGTGNGNGTTAPPITPVKPVVPAPKTNPNNTGSLYAANNIAIGLLGNPPHDPAADQAFEDLQKAYNNAEITFTTSQPEIDKKTADVRAAIAKYLAVTGLTPPTTISTPTTPSTSTAAADCGIGQNGDTDQIKTNV